MVIEKDKQKYNTRGVRWICKCDCGTVKSVLGKNLRNGTTESCGCSRHQNLKGKRYGKLLVLETIYNYNGSKRAVHKCMCDCGNIIIINSPTIMQKSCGCSRRNKSIVGEKFGKLVVEKMLYNYKNDNITYCECKCDCGHTIIIKRQSLIDGNTQSCGCAHSPSLLNKRFGRLVVLEEMDSHSHQRRWRCKCDCGLETVLTSYQLTSGHTKSCGCLRSETTSYYERLIGKLLFDMNIKYEKEKVFEKCKGIGNKSLRFDFYLPEYNLCIEYDGKQHYQPIQFFGGEANYQKQIKNDKIKDRYCQDNNIMLIRIPYTFSKQEINDIINSIIQNPVTTTVI